MRWCPDGDFGDFFCVLCFSEPPAAGFRPASQIRTKGTPCVEVWQTSNLRRLRSGEEKKEERRTNHSMKIYMVSLLHRATINKSELLWCATARRRHQLPSCPLRIGPDAIIPSTAVRDLGIYSDCDLSMQVHVQRSVADCFAVLRQLRSIQRFVPSSVYQWLVVALVLSRLDYTVMRHWLVF